MKPRKFKEIIDNYNSDIPADHLENIALGQFEYVKNMMMDLVHPVIVLDGLGRFWYRYWRLEDDIRNQKKAVAMSPNATEYLEKLENMKKMQEDEYKRLGEIIEKRKKRSRGEEERIEMKSGRMAIHVYTRGCRCRECTDVQAIYMQRYRKSKKEKAELEKYRLQKLKELGYDNNGEDKKSLGK